MFQSTDCLISNQTQPHYFRLWINATKIGHLKKTDVRKITYFFTFSTLAFQAVIQAKAGLLASFI